MFAVSIYIKFSALGADLINQQSALARLRYISLPPPNKQLLLIISAAGVDEIRRPKLFLSLSSTPPWNIRIGTLLFLRQFLYRSPHLYHRREIWLFVRIQFRTSYPLTSSLKFKFLFAQVITKKKGKGNWSEYSAVPNCQEKWPGTRSFDDLLTDCVYCVNCYVLRGQCCSYSHISFCAFCVKSRQ